MPCSLSCIRTPSRTTQFKKDFKRESRGRYRQILDDELRIVLGLLLADTALPQRYRDHALTGDWAGFRDCHLRPDLVLIYSKPDDHTVALVRIGSHSELSL
jgi:mRNA interferase YafQ